VPRRIRDEKLESGSKEAKTQTEEPKEPDEKQQSGGISWRQAVGNVGLALAIPWMIGVPALLGWWLDKKFETSPWCLIIGVVLGLVTTALDIYKLMKKFGQLK